MNSEIPHQRAKGEMDAAEQIRESGDAAEDTFICSRCGQVSLERERSPGTTECIFC